MAPAGLEGAFPPGLRLHSRSLPPACRISEDLKAFFRITRVTEATGLAGLSCPWNKVLSRGRGSRRRNGTGSVALRLGSAGRRVNPDARPHDVRLSDHSANRVLFPQQLPTSALSEQLQKSPEHPLRPHHSYTAAHCRSPPLRVMATLSPNLPQSSFPSPAPCADEPGKPGTDP